MRRSRLDYSRSRPGERRAEFRWCLAAGLLLWLGPTNFSAAEEPAKGPLVIEDLFRMDAIQSVVVAPGEQSGVGIRRWVDPQTRAERFSLWGIEGESTRRLEPGEPDARSPVFSPDGRWVAVRSTRPRPRGWRQTPGVPPQSEPATDVWLVSVDGGRSVPLAGPEKPYGRVFNDLFYARVAFSPDGRYLAFVADDGRDPRTPDEIAADVYVVRPDQGEGYTGYATAQVWLAELDQQPTDRGAKSVRRLTDDDIWYGDLQWAPDGRTLFCHANKSGDVEAVRNSINKNYDIWAIDVASGRQRQMTTGPGPEVSPRVSPDGSRLVCLRSPRKGPHADVYNLLLVSLDGGGPEANQTVVYDHHASAGKPPHPIPAFPLPDDCWDGEDAIWYTHFNRTQTDTVRVNLETAEGTVVGDQSGDSPLGRRWAARRRLAPPSDRWLKDRALGEERVIEWSNDRLRLDGTITIPRQGAAPFPLVVYPHGGPHSRTTTGFNFTAQILAANGYLVSSPTFAARRATGSRFSTPTGAIWGAATCATFLQGSKRWSPRDWPTPSGNSSTASATAVS